MDTEWETCLGAEAVTLVTASSWRRIPPPVRARVTSRVRSLRQLRTVIGETALVRTMPPVRVIGTGWDPYAIGCVWGRTTEIPLRDGWTWGCELPASTLIAVEDDERMRDILVHEFAHAFWNAQDVITNNGAGIGADDPRLDRDAADRACLVEPSEWFAASDAARFAYHGDPRFNECMDVLRSRWIDAGLPIEPPPAERGTLRKMTVYLPDDVIQHVEALRAKLRSN